MTTETRQAAIYAVRGKLGLLDTLPIDWTYEQRAQYNTELARVLLAMPDAASVDRYNANVVLNNQFQPLEKTGVLTDLSTFGTEFGNQALRVGDAVAQVGEGTISTLKLASWVIPVGALAVAAIYLISFAKSKGVIK